MPSPYLPHTDAECNAMLREIGASSVEEQVTSAKSKAT